MSLAEKIQRWLPKKTGRVAADKTVVEFLPDADEIERTPAPYHARVTLHILSAILIFFLIWASVSSVEQIVVARGRLVASQPNVVIQPLETSIVNSVEVRIGQVVNKGERLVTLDPTFTGADESQLRTRLQSLDNQLRQIESVLSGDSPKNMPSDDADNQLQTRLSGERLAGYFAQLNRLSETVSQLRATLETERQNAQSLASRVGVLKEMENMQRDMADKKLVARDRYLEAQNVRIEAERSLAIAKGRQVELRHELGALEAEKKSFATGWRQKIMEEQLTVSRERDDVREQLQKADFRHKLVQLTAPVNAVVLEVASLAPGSVVQAADKLVTLVPLDGALEAEVEIDTENIGYVHAGNPAHIKLDAFPFQKHGVMEAELRMISGDAFRRNTGSGGGTNGYYAGRLTLKHDRLDKMPEQARLLPGMTLAAEVVVGERSVISYVIWPLTKALNESLREP